MKTVKIKDGKKSNRRADTWECPPFPPCGWGVNEMKMLIGRKKMKNKVVKLSEIMEEES